MGQKPGRWKLSSRNQKKIQIELPEKLYPLFSGKARYRVAHGGRGSSKSWAFARMLLARAYQKKTRILCARELQNSIRDSVHKLLVDQIETIGFGGFIIQKDSIRHVNGSEFIFKGLRTNANEIKSMEGIDICWVEEAQAVSQNSWDVVIPTIRAKDSEIWITFNPLWKTDPTSQKFIENPHPDSLIAEINYPDNPWFPEELRKEMEYMKEIDFDAYKNVWCGEYKDPNKGGRVVSSWSIANIEELPYEPQRRLYLSCDFNVDPMVWMVAHIHQVAGGQKEYRFIDEIAMENTTIMAAAEEFYFRYRGHSGGLIITGDASGNSRSDTTARENQTRYKLLTQCLSDFGWKSADYALDAPSANPLKKDRREIFNKAVRDHNGIVRVKVDPKCKRFIGNCEGLTFIPGSDEILQPTPKHIQDDPKRKWDRQDPYDAGSYLICRYEPKMERADRVTTKVVTSQFKPGRR